MSAANHYSVLLEESVAALVAQPDGVYVDGTFGRGGHSAAILHKLNAEGRLVVFDKDPEAIEVAKQMAASDSRISVCHNSFANLELELEKLGVKGQVAGVLLDLGVSSPQLDQAERGFSFIQDGPLDMRMDPTQGESAASWINRAKEVDIAQVLFEYGEERFSRRIARAIVARRAVRPFERTLDLADVITKANPKWERDKHPATRAFQAIRIEINQELNDLDKALDAIKNVLAPAGRMVIISFHSLEDRRVKRFIKLESQGPVLPKGLPMLGMPKISLKNLGKSRASGDELKMNVRSRSAILRIAEKLG